MQIKVNSPLTFQDKNILSVFHDTDSGTLEVIVGEELERSIRIKFEEVLGFIKTNRSGIQMLIEETEQNEFLKDMLSLRYDPGELKRADRFPKVHPFKRYVFYQYCDRDQIFSEPSLEVVATSVKVEEFEQKI